MELAFAFTHVTLGTRLLDMTIDLAPDLPNLFLVLWQSYETDSGFTQRVLDN